MANLIPGAFLGRLLVTIAMLNSYQQLAFAYNVAEHRLDYIKLGEGREYNYHYNDGVASGFDKRKFFKGPQAFKQPYTFKSFPSPVEQIATNEFQSQPEQSSYLKQESLLPVYESHEKSIHYVPVDFTSQKSTGATGNHAPGRPGESQYSLPPQTGSSTSSYMSNLAERVIQMIHLRHPSSAKNVSSSGSPAAVPHFQSSGIQYHQQHPGSYQYFNAHPAPSSYELVRPINNFPPPRPYLAPALTTTKAPYVAPFLLKTSTTTTTPAPSPIKAARRPFSGGQKVQAPTQRPPYVAPGVTSDPLLNSLAVANQLKYTSSSGRPSTVSKPAATATQDINSQKPYEPEFDIDIRIDLRDDSAQ